MLFTSVVLMAMACAVVSFGDSEIPHGELEHKNLICAELENVDRTLKPFHPGL
jgi:hypothetical protein